MLEYISLQGKITDLYYRLEHLLDENRKLIISLPDEKAIVFNTSRSWKVKITSARYYVHKIYGQTYTYIQYRSHISPSKVSTVLYPKHTLGREQIYKLLNEFYTLKEIKAFRNTIQSRRCSPPMVNLKTFSEDKIITKVTTSKNTTLEGITLPTVSIDKIKDYILAQSEKVCGVLHIVSELEVINLYIRINSGLILYTYHQDSSILESYLLPYNGEGIKSFPNNVFEIPFLLDEKDILDLMVHTQIHIEQDVYCKVSELKHFHEPVTHKNIKVIHDLLNASVAPRFIIAPVKDNSALKEIYYRCLNLSNMEIIAKIYIHHVSCLGKNYNYLLKDILDLHHTTTSIESWEYEDRVAAGILLTHCHPNILKDPVILEDLTPPVVTLEQIQNYEPVAVLTNTSKFTKSYQFIKVFNEMDENILIVASNYFPALLVKQGNHVIVYKFFTDDAPWAKKQRYACQAVLCNFEGESLQKLPPKITKIPFLLDMKSVANFLENHGFNKELWEQNTLRTKSIVHINL